MNLSGHQWTHNRVSLHGLVKDAGWHSGSFGQVTVSLRFLFFLCVSCYPPSNPKLASSSKDPLEKGRAAHSSILAWRIPQTEESDGVQSMGSQRVRHNWSSLACSHHSMYCTPSMDNCVPLSAGRWARSSREDTSPPWLCERPHSAGRCPSTTAAPQLSKLQETFLL